MLRPLASSPSVQLVATRPAAERPAAEPPAVERPIVVLVLQQHLPAVPRDGPAGLQHFGSPRGVRRPERLRQHFRLLLARCRAAAPRAGSAALYSSATRSLIGVNVEVIIGRFSPSISVRMPEWGARRLVPYPRGFESATCSRKPSRSRVSGRAHCGPAHCGPAHSGPAHSGPGDSGPGDRRATALPGAALILLGVCVVCVCVFVVTSRGKRAARPTPIMITSTSFSVE